MEPVNSAKELAIRVADWAAAELSLEAVPPTPVLEALVSSTPRVTTLWNHIVEHVRAPDHAAQIRDTQSFISLGTEIARKKLGAYDADAVQKLRAEIQFLDQEAAAVQADVDELNSKILRALSRQESSCWGPQKQAEENYLQNVLYESHATALSQLNETVRSLASAAILDTSDELPPKDTQVDDSSAIAAEEAVQEVMRVIQNTSKIAYSVPESPVPSAGQLHHSQGFGFQKTSLPARKSYCHDPDKARQIAWEYLGRLGKKHSAKNIVLALEKANREGYSYPTHYASLKEKTRPSSLDHEHTAIKRGDAWNALMRELRNHQLQLFLETEKVSAQQKAAEDLLQNEISDYMRNETVPNSELEQGLIMAKLDGEKAAAVAIEREIKSLRSRTFINTEGTVSLLDELNSLERAAKCNQETIAKQDSLKIYLQQENSHCLRNLSSLGDDVCLLLEKKIGESCALASESAADALVASRNAVLQILSMRTISDGILRRDSTWKMISDFSVLSDRAELLDEHDNTMNSWISDDWTICKLDLEQTKYVLDLHREATILEIEKGSNVVSGLEARIKHLEVSHHRDRRLQDEQFYDVFTSSLDDLKDCIQSLVPAARHAVDVSIDQPVRKAAPWQRVRGMSLAEWECESLEANDEETGFSANDQ